MKKFNLTTKQLTDLFTTMGAELVVVDKEVDGVNVEDIALELRPEVDAETMRKGLEKEVKDAEFGKWMGSLRVEMARQFGLKRGELEGMAMANIVELAKSAITNRTTETEGSLRKEIEKLTNDHNTELDALEQRITKEWEQKVTDAQNQYIQRDIKESWIDITNKIPRSGGDAIRQAEQLMREAAEKFHVKYNSDKKMLEFFDKADPNKPALNNNKPIAASDFATEYYGNLGVYVKDTRRQNATDTHSGKNGNYKSGAATTDNGDSDKYAGMPDAFQQAMASAEAADAGQ